MAEDASQLSDKERRIRERGGAEEQDFVLCLVIAKRDTLECEATCCRLHYTRKEVLCETTLPPWTPRALDTSPPLKRRIDGQQIE